MNYWYVFRNGEGCIVVADELPRETAHSAECFTSKSSAYRRAAVRRSRMIEARPIHYLYAAIVLVLITFGEAIVEVLLW